MNFDLLHPADQIVLIMRRLYSFGMTTTSGGNLSIKDSDGVIWISPGSIDKGTLEREDIVKVMPGGEVIGMHKPSVELPIHKMVYQRRPETRAVLHAHPPSLVAFSAIRQVPATDMIANIRVTCGEIRTGGYALPGSEELGVRIADQFALGADVVMMDNHGALVAAEDLFRAFSIFETLDYCARIQINSFALGKLRRLTGDELTLYSARYFPEMEEYSVGEYASDERYYRQAMCGYIHRAYNQQLFTATQGTFSRRLPDGSFFITPYGKDRMYLEPGDLVNIRDGRREAGKTPSRAVMLHKAVYDAHPEIQAIAIAHPPNIMAFAVTGREFDARLIPESYIMLKQVQRAPYGSNLVRHNNQVVENISIKTPVCMIENDCVVVAGTGLLNVFDRLEVLEYSAKSVVAAGQLQKPIHALPEEKIKEIEVAFNL
jgi:L-fuculose-phosphate aldolase